MSSPTCDIPKMRKLVESAPNLAVLQRNVLQYFDTCTGTVQVPEGTPSTPPPEPKKKKRAPSERNKFIGTCTPKKRAENPGMKQTEAFKACSDDWKQAHPKTPEVKK